MIISSSAITANLQAVAEKLSTPLPAAFMATVTAARALPPGADAYTGATAELHAAALAALAAGNDPGDDPAVQRLAIHHALSQSGLRAAAEELAGDQITAALREYADTIAAGWGESIQGDLATLTDAAAVLDLADLDAAEPVLLKRGNTLNTWAEATSAADRVDTALTGMRALLAALHVPHSFAIDGLLLVPDAGLDVVRTIAAVSSRGNLKAWATARAVAPAPMRLATVSEFTAGTARINAEMQSRERDADAKAAAAATPAPAPTRKREWTRVR